MAQNMLFWSTLIKFARLSDLETDTLISKRELVAIRRRMKSLELKLCRFLQI